MKIYTLNAICPYYTMFPLDFPLSILSEAKKSEWVLDPFSGRGTTNFAARVHGLPSVGIDSSPVAAAITAAKLSSAKTRTILQLARDILASEEPDNVPTGEFWDLAFHPVTLIDICRLRTGLSKRRGNAANLLRAFLLGRLHGPVLKGLPSYLSNQMPRTYASKPDYAVRFWRQRDLKPFKVDVMELIVRKAPYYFDVIPKTVEGRSVLGDSRRINFSSVAEPFSWVVTSPPYYGMRTYVPDQWLRNWFLGGSSTVAYEYSKQLQHTGPDVFANQLAEVWRAVAKASAPAAKLWVRFGGMPQNSSDPQEVLLQSLRQTPWSQKKILPAGLPKIGRRQANSFLRKVGKPVEEFDLHAVLI